MKQISLILAVLMIALPVFSIGAEAEIEVEAKSVILMEAQSGRVLYEENADEPLPPASVTKIMTLLLVMEALEEGKIALNDMVSTSETAAQMGGSQVYLEPGEEMTVEEMKAYINANMARHKVPRYVDFVKAFPMNAAGKILKYKMREDAAKRLGLTGDGADTAGNPGK